MLKTLVSGLIVGVIGLAALPAQAQVATKSGQVSGVTAGGVVSYRGIPYAKPPVGDLRWRAPQPAAAWTGVKKAEAYGAACPQPNREDGGGGGRAEVQSEDCLTLNVFAPKDAKNLPVMVWIHGGAFRLGSGTFPIYDGANLAKQGVVLVTINYRIGLLGFLAHPALTKEAKPGDPIGNYGLMDQLAALQWVQDNIAAFGGDPRNVTAFGESAGGSSMIYLLANPRAKGLFAKAIVESGGGLQQPVKLPENEKRGTAFAAAIGLGPDATLAQMRAKPAQDWVKAQGGLQGGLGFGPFIDGRLVTEAPWEAFKAGRALDVPLIIGANSNEASVLTTLGANPAAIGAATGARQGEFRKLYGDIADAEFQRQAMGDIVFVAPSRWIAGQSASGAPAYLYYFNYVASMRRNAVPGSNHGSEIPFIFKTWDQTPLLARLVSAEDRKFADTLSACWVAFAKTGQPACDGAPAWPRYDVAKDELMEFGPKPSVHKSPKAAAFDLLVAQFMRAR